MVQRSGTTSRNTLVNTAIVTSKNMDCRVRHPAGVLMTRLHNWSLLELLVQGSSAPSVRVLVAKVPCNKASRQAGQDKRGGRSSIYHFRYECTCSWRSNGALAGDHRESWPVRITQDFFRGNVSKEVKNIALYQSVE